MDWTPIIQFTDDTPALNDGLCENCLQYPFEFDGGFVCAQCGTKWSAPAYMGQAYAEWSGRDATGIPVKNRTLRGLGIYR